MTTLKLDNLSFVYHGLKKSVLNNVNAEFTSGTFYAIVGNSGAGKSTLLGLLAGLDEPTRGKILLDGQDVAERGYAYHRQHNVSLVFQNYNLIDYLTPLENVKLVDPKAKIDSLLNVGLSEDEAKRNVMKLSGGQQQRVAIARALASNSPVILADEPTGNLDGDTAAEMIEILRRLAHEQDKCVIVVTHSKQLAHRADVVFRLKNRNLVRQ
ncbi:ABC transporter ATP-binding protein [Schaalia sp. ZJ405]|uniref:ABC transporter ATP-binding protein n=1 Tax=Schaalia sp. ZJ405 TaxID=2709403 RepID=UPI0013EAD370|nr:ABC transporter ATP-binding protein [Schaalia sp. ZJ405]QPK80853.1 ABC transporter ATP-binding protein [Schaalia sp. ZJ405]